MKELLLEFRPELSWEFLSADEIERKSVRAIRNHIRHVKECSAFYREKLSDITPEDITELEDISLLPLTTREELARHSSKFLGVPPKAIIETVVTGGASGRPLPFVFTKSDLDRVAFNQALSFNAIKMTAEDRVQLLLSLDQFSINGMAHYRGALMIGANTMRIGVGTAKPDIFYRYLKFFKPTVLAGTPSSLRLVAESLLKHHFDPSDSSIDKIVCTGEGILTKDLQRNALGKQLEQRFGAEVFASYSVTELSISYGECTERCGTHAQPELVYTEIVDEHGYPVPDGEIGELVATPLGVEGVPLVRYRTGDITFKVPGACSCGRNSCRLGPILNRESVIEPVATVKHEYTSFTYNGTAVEPSSLIEALESVFEVKDFIIIIDCESGTSDAVTIQVAAPPAALAAINQAVKAATDVFIPVLISNIPTIQSLRDGSKEKIPLIDNRRKMTVGQR